MNVCESLFAVWNIMSNLSSHIMWFAKKKIVYTNILWWKDLVRPQNRMCFFLSKSSFVVNKGVFSWTRSHTEVTLPHIPIVDWYHKSLAPALSFFLLSRSAPSVYFTLANVSLHGAGNHSLTWKKLHLLSHYQVFCLK